MSKVLKQLFREELEKAGRKASHLRLVPPPPPPPDFARLLLKPVKKPTVKRTRLYALFTIFLCVSGYSYWLITEGRRLDRAVTYQRKVLPKRSVLQGVKPVMTEPLAEMDEEREISEASLQLNREGMDLFKKQKFPEAAILFARSAEIDPLNPLSLINLGMSKAKLKEFKEAKEILTKAGKLLGSASPLAGSPKLEVVYNNLGAIGIEEKSFGPAILYFQKAIQLNPEYVDARLNLAKAMELAGRPMDAAREYQEFIDNARLNSALKPAIQKRLAKLNAFIGYLKEEEDAMKAEKALLNSEDLE
jgi:tetratricopeptide (TPR) repeat protein